MSDPKEGYRAEKLDGHSTLDLGISDFTHIETKVGHEIMQKDAATLNKHLRDLADKIRLQ